MILDLSDPARPEEVGRWWLPGQWRAAEARTTPGTTMSRRAATTPLRVGEALYVSYWHHGFVILDIGDPSRPVALAGRNTTSCFPPPHPYLPAPARDAEGPGRHDRGRRGRGQALPFGARLRLGLGHHRRAQPPRRSRPSRWRVSTPTVARSRPSPAATNPASGSRAPPSFPSPGSPRGCVWSISRTPSRPREVGWWRPEPPAGCERASSNDVTRRRARARLPRRSPARRRHPGNDALLRRAMPVRRLPPPSRPADGAA